MKLTVLVIDSDHNRVVKTVCDLLQKDFRVSSASLPEMGLMEFEVMKKDFFMVFLDYAYCEDWFNKFAADPDFAGFIAVVADNPEDAEMLEKQYELVVLRSDIAGTAGYLRQKLNVLDCHYGTGWSGISQMIKERRNAAYSNYETFCEMQHEVLD